jgi:hypothetical protein
MSDQINDIQSQIDALHQQLCAALARKFVAEHMAGATDQEKDEGLLRIIGNHLEKRLAKLREQDAPHWLRGGEATDTELMAKLQADLAAGNFLGAAGYAAMLHVRKHL